LYGAGDHSKVVLWTIEAAKELKIAGLLDDNPLKSTLTILGHPILGGLEKLDFLKDNGVNQAVISIGDNRIRSQIYHRLLQFDFEVIRVIHPTANVLRGSEILEGAVILPQAYIGPDVFIGKNAIVSVGVVIGHDCRLGVFAHLCPNVSLGGHVQVGEFTTIGMGASILPGVKIGNHVLVGANTVVLEDVPDHTKIAGVPGRKIGRPLHNSVTKM
jgi:sugar O-acyltransferase (sialic acid O-acetyltransferase NeuD family)